MPTIADAPFSSKVTEPINLGVFDPIDTLRFMFAVGIECSCPTSNDGVRVDQLRDTGHYELWQTDLKLVRELGLRYLRYGPPIHRVLPAQGQYDWSLLDPVMDEMQRLGIIADHRPGALWPAGLAGGFSKPGLAEAFRRICGRVCRAISVGAVLHAGE